ncbi:MAG: oligosaccharide flippase family protein [Pyrinomonadaceae bacterium]
MNLQKPTKKHRDLIYDVGLNLGQDTDFYLKKGFRVIAFEADPDNVATCKKRFADAIESGQLIIVEGAIVENKSASKLTKVRFYRNEDHPLWGSTCEDWAYRNEVMGTRNEIIEVEAVDFAECLEKYGIPFYLKADIVGSEVICLKALQGFENKPDYISIRSEKVIFRKLKEEFDLLENLGYGDFKAIQQDFHNLKIPIESPEKVTSLYQFEEGASGTFGEDTDGDWKDCSEILTDYKKIFVLYWLFGDYSFLIQTARGQKLIGRLERLVRRPLPGWYDTHARHSSFQTATVNGEFIPEVNEKKASLKSQSAWLLFAKIIGFVIAFILPLLIVRVLSQEQVGVYRLSFLVIMNAAAILPVGFSMSAYYFLNREKEKRGAAIFNILLFNFAVGGLAFLTLFFFPDLLGNAFQTAEMTQLAPKIGLVIWIWIISTILETVAIANQETKLATFFIIFSQFSKTSLMAVAIVYFTSVDALINAAIIQGVLQLIVLFYYLQTRFPQFWRGFSWTFFRRQMIYAVPFGLAGILWILQNDIHNYFVGYRFSEAEFAIYAYGCFQLPLIAMLFESVNSVLIPRMSELQARGDKDEMIRLTARAMDKLSFFYFPIYAFLLVTAQTFIITLFTRHYLAAVPIFIINLTLLPFQIILTDPIVRAYKELGRFLLGLRVFILIGLVAALYFGIHHFDLRGMIAISVAAALVEKFIAEFVIIRRLGVGRKHLPLLTNVGKTALAALIAGVATFVFYTFVKDYFFLVGEHFAESILDLHKLAVVNFVGGSLTLAMSFIVFLPIYLISANMLGIIEAEEKAYVYRFLYILKRFFKLKKQVVN